MEHKPPSHDPPPPHPDVIHQPGACVLKVAPGLRLTGKGNYGVILFDAGFGALSYFHFGTSDDYIFAGADDEVMSFDAQSTIEHNKEKQPKVPPAAILILDLDKDDDPTAPPCPQDAVKGIWYYDPGHFKNTPISSSAGNLNVITELPGLPDPVGLNVLVTRRCVREIKSK